MNQQRLQEVRDFVEGHVTTMPAWLPTNNKEALAAMRPYLKVIAAQSVRKIFAEEFEPLLRNKQNGLLAEQRIEEVVSETLDVLPHSSNPEYENLENCKHIDALRDRTVKVDIPYLIQWEKETNG